MHGFLMIVVVLLIPFILFGTGKPKGKQKNDPLKKKEPVVPDEWQGTIEWIIVVLIIGYILA